MRNTISIFFCSVILATSCIAQCNLSYSLNVFDDSVVFDNTSSISNAHYYWNFGDGQTSNITSPGHRFPESGDYIVTLYALDTISGCHGAKDSLINITKLSSDPCQPGLNYFYSTNAWNDLLTVNDVSSNCNSYNAYLNAGPAMNFSANNSIYIDSSWMPANFIGSIRYVTHDSINGYATKREYYATMPYHYSSAVNYDSCSANFEFYISYQSDGALVTFHAMNPAQTSFDFVITGLGNPIHLYSNNSSFLMPYVSYEKYFPWLIGSYSLDASGCRDSCWQQMLIRDINFFDPPSCAIAFQPQDQTVEEGSAISIIAQTETQTTLQWQLDDGTGFHNLTDAGKYTGTNTDTLHINDVTMEMNHFKYKCTVSNNICGCHNTSAVSTLIVEHGDVMLYPNPAKDKLNLVFTSNQDTSTVTIYDIPGHKIFSEAVFGQTATLDISSFAQGCYIAEIKTGKSTYKKKFVVE